MSDQIVECVPNFSEGRNQKVIKIRYIVQQRSHTSQLSETCF